MFDTDFKTRQKQECVWRNDLKILFKVGCVESSLFLADTVLEQDRALIR